MKLSERLRRSLAPAAPPAPAPAPDPDPAAAARQARLGQLRREVERIARRYSLQPSRPSPQQLSPAAALQVDARPPRPWVGARPEPPPPAPRAPAWEPRSLPESVDDEGLLFRKLFTAADRFGREPVPGLELALEASLHALLRLEGWGEDACFPRLDEVLFLDLETTGLSRSAGTLAFIIGYGSFEGGALRVEQLLLRDPAREPEVLELLRPHLERARLLVTYNGRAFDVPVLRNRSILGRVPLALERGHLDLLPVCRRLFRARLPNCRLGTIERQLFGFERVGDIDGAEAPRIYADFLASGRTGELAGMLEHNRFDVAVLSVLLRCASQHATDPLHWAEDAEELLGAGLMQLRRGDAELGEACLGRGLELACSPVTQRRLIAALARQLRRRGLHHEAGALWERHRRDFPGHSAGWIEAAKYHEHVTHDLARALALAEATPHLEPSGEHARRLERLRRRVGRERSVDDAAVAAGLAGDQ